MTSAAADPSSLGDDDIRAFGARPAADASSFASASASAAAAAAASMQKTRKRRWWPWLVLGAMLLAVIGALVLAANLVGDGLHGWHMSVDDDVVFDGAGSLFGAALAIGITAIVLLGVGAFLALLFPLVLVVVLGAVALAVGVPLALLVVLLALLTSPLWLPVALLVWWLA